MHIREDGRVRDRFDEPGAKERHGNAKDDVRIPALAGERVAGGQEVELGDVAARRVGTPGDDEDGMHVAIVGSVRIALKACFADGPILRDEPWHHVLRAIESGDCDQGVSRRARSAGGRVRVARQTLVGVEARAESIVAASTHGLDFSKPGEPILKERVFVRGEAGQWIAGTGRAAPHPGVDGSF